jgi:outer membrane protein assembly factor BamD (BamD/ComL family)
MRAREKAMEIYISHCMVLFGDSDDEKEMVMARDSALVTVSFIREAWGQYPNSQYWKDVEKHLKKIC